MTSSWPRPDARWRAPAMRPAGEPTARTRAPRRTHERRAIRTGRRARQALDAQDAAPAVPALSDRVLPADPSGRQRQRLEGGHTTARLPHPFIHLVCDRRGVHPGRDVLADQHRHQPRGGHRERLLQQAGAHTAASRLADRRPAGRSGSARRDPVRGLRPDGSACRSEPGSRHRRRGRAARAGGDHLRRLRGAGLCGRPEDRVGRGRPGVVPAVLRLHLPVLEQPAPQPAEDGLVPHGRHLEPDFLPDRGLQEPLHIRVGRHCAMAWLRRGRGLDSARADGRRRSHEREDAAHMSATSPPSGGVWRVALAIAWRSLHTYVRRPDLFVPSLVFPLVFLASFAGGLKALGSVPGFHFPAGYTAFQFVFVLCQSAMFSGLFTGFTLAFDFESGFARRLMLAAEDRRGIVLGYALVALSRAALTLILVTAVALIAGMQITGDGVDLVGLYGLATILVLVGYAWAAGVAFRFRSIQAGPLMQTPVFLILFLAPVYVPLSLLKGWIHSVASINPATAFLGAGRGLISGVHDHTALAYASALALVVLFGVWMLSGLRNAERAG